VSEQQNHNTNVHLSSCDTLIAAMRILARDIDSQDGVANAAIAEAADRLEEFQNALLQIRELGLMYIDGHSCIMNFDGRSHPCATAARNVLGDD